MSDAKAINVKIPLDLHERLVKAAAADVRSIHGEIIWFLREGVERHEAEKRELSTTAE